MWQTHDLFLKHKAKKKELRTHFEGMSRETQGTADKAKEEVQRQSKKAGELKTKMDQLIQLTRRIH